MINERNSLHTLIMRAPIYIICLITGSSATSFKYRIHFRINHGMGFFTPTAILYDSNTFLGSILYAIHFIFLYDI